MQHSKQTLNPHRPKNPESRESFQDCPVLRSKSSLIFLLILFLSQKLKILSQIPFFSFPLGKRACRKQIISLLCQREKGLKIVIYVPVGVIIFIHSIKEEIMNESTELLLLLHVTLLLLQLLPTTENTTKNYNYKKMCYSSA